jgi:hypothetical protein
MLWGDGHCKTSQRAECLHLGPWEPSSSFLGPNLLAHIFTVRWSKRASVMVWTYVRDLVFKFRGETLRTDWTWGLWHNQRGNALMDSWLSGNWNVGLVGGSRSVGVCLRRVHLSSGLFPHLLSASWLPWGEQLSSAMAPCHGFFGPTSMKPVNHGPKTLKAWAKTNLSFFKLLFTGIFVPAIKKEHS